MSYTFKNASTLNSTIALQSKVVSDRVSVTAVDHNRNEDEFLFNQISASKYQEFKVIKINARGKKQERVLAIDGYNIYNEMTEEDKRKPCMRFEARYLAM